MADQTITSAEEMIGSGHVTKADTLNRLALVEHNTDGTHAGGGLVVTSTNVVTDHQLVRGDGGARGVQESTIIVDDSGRMTNPSQPCFNVSPTTNQENIAVGNGVTVVFGTERVDVGNNFAANMFTAPITGKYYLGVSLYLQSIPADAGYVQISIETNNKSYRLIFSITAAMSYLSFMLAVIADMDINDAAYVQIIQSAGTQQIDINTYSVFSGALIC